MVRLRAVLTSLGAVAVVALLPAGSAHAASPAKRCTAKGAKTVVKNRYARVFTTRGDPHEQETGRLYGCMLSVGKRVLLAVAQDDEFVYQQSFDNVRLNRRFVAWQYTTYDIACKADCPPGYQPTRHLVMARDLRAARSREFNGAVKGDSLVVGRRGTPAWLQDAEGGGVEAHAGKERLDTGAIDALSLDGSTLSWVNAGAPKSAQLDP